MPDATSDPPCEVWRVMSFIEEVETVIWTF